MKNKIFIGDNLSIMTDDKFKKEIGKLKVIYIDPPYNTGSNLSYNDKKKKNDWSNFMEKRLLAAYDFLTDDGCIFISIDDNQYAELKIICDKIFNHKNFIGTFITMQSQRSNTRHINIIHEYIVCYAKNKSLLKNFKIKRKDIPEQNQIIETLYKSIKPFKKDNDFEGAKKKLQETIKNICIEYNISWIKNYGNIDENWKIYFPKDLSTPTSPKKVNIPEINLYLEPLKSRGWVSDKKFIELYKKEKLVYRNGRPYEKHLLEDSEDNVSSILNFYSRGGTNDLNKLGLRDLFDTPKPVELIKFLLRISTEDNDTVLDFFAGSGSTAQAVYEVNIEDKKHLKYVLIQMDESVKENTKAYNICLRLKIEPLISNIMIYRINTYLNNINQEIDYKLYKKEE